jgi:M6 family metalloprotease-like protein
MSHPFFGEEFTFSQPDGSTIQVRAWGDQQNALFETLDGQQLTRDASGALTPVPGATRAASTEARDVPLPARAVPAPPPPGSAGLRVTGTRWQQRRAEQRMRRAVSADGPLPAPPMRQTVGTFVGLCLLIDFPDVPATIGRDEVERFCNLNGYNGFGNRGSVSDYFRDVSGGLVTYTNLVAPYYTARHNRAYYTDETIAQPLRAIELITEALDHLVAQQFDFSTLSTDDRDFVFALNVFYAGKVVNNWAKGLWPHAYGLPSPYRLGPNVIAHDYQITDIGTELSLGTFCHENGHMLCDFPDLYDYDSKSFGVGVYCLMCAGGNVSRKNPIGVNGYLKLAAGWASDVTELTTGQTVTLAAGSNQLAVFRKSSTEYFVFENRQRRGRDAALPDAGLAIWHVDELGDNSNEQMSPTLHYECTLVQADGRSDLEKKRNMGDPNDLFHKGHNDRFDGTSHPPSAWWDGSASGLKVSNISASGASMTFSVA